MVAVSNQSLYAHIEHIWALFKKWRHCDFIYYYLVQWKRYKNWSLCSFTCFETCCLALNNSRSNHCISMRIYSWWCHSMTYLFMNDVIVLTFRCICSQALPPPETSRSHPVQPPGSGRSTPGPDVPHGSSHQSAEAASGRCKVECCALQVWRSGSPPDLSGLLFGPFGPKGMSFVHIPTHLLPPPGASEPALPCPVWGVLH